MSIENKLTYLEGTKTAIKDAIVAKGVAIDDNATFRSYATAISTIETGGGTAINNQTKTVEINQNGQTTVSYDEGYTGLESVVINTNVPTGSGDCTLNVCFDDLYIEAKQKVEDMIQYTINLQNNYTSTTKYTNDNNIFFAPNIDVSGRTNVSQLFYSSNVTVLPTTYDFSSATDAHQMFQNCYNLTKIPTYDFSNVTDLENCFSGCSALVKIVGLNLNKITYLKSSFSNCVKLTEIGDITSWNTVNLTNLNSTFDNDSNLDLSDKLKDWNVSKVTDLTQCFYNIGGTSLDISNWNLQGSVKIFRTISGSKLEKILLFDCSNLTDNYSSNYSFIGAQTSTCKVFLLKNICTNSNWTAANFNLIPNWGTGSNEARQSLIDTLLTYSFDRATAGYSPCTLKLADNTKAVLTEEEIAQITAKNYTIA